MKKLLLLIVLISPLLSHAEDKITETQEDINTTPPSQSQIKIDIPLENGWYYIQQNSDKTNSIITTPAIKDSDNKNTYIFKRFNGYRPSVMPNNADNNIAPIHTAMPASAVSYAANTTDLLQKQTELIKALSSKINQIEERITALESSKGQNNNVGQQKAGGAGNNEPTN